MSQLQTMRRTEGGRMAQELLNYHGLIARELGGTVLTDDYSIQNVASRLGIPYEVILERGIREVVRWRYRCTGCGKFFEKPTKECPVCGARVKTTRAHP